MKKITDEMATMTYPRAAREQRKIRAFNHPGSGKVILSQDKAFVVTYLAYDEDFFIQQRSLDNPNDPDENWTINFTAGCHRLADPGNNHVGAGIVVDAGRLISCNKPVFIFGYERPQVH